MTAAPVVRLATARDAAAVQAIYAPYVRETAISFENDPPTIGEMEARIARIGAKFPWLIYEADGMVLGYAYGGAHRDRAAYQWSADVSVYVAKDAHRRGVGRALYGRLIPLLARQGCHTLYGGITLPNAGSVGLHEAFGFSPVGIYPEVGFKFGAWHDVGWWGRRLESPASAPRPITPFEPAMLEEVT